MGNDFNFDNCSLVELQKISAEIQVIIKKKAHDEEQEAWKEFRQAYRKFRAKVPDSSVYVEYRCEECDCWDDIEVLERLDDYFNSLVIA